MTRRHVSRPRPAAAHTSLSGGDLAGSADPDRDGLSNILEYAFGTSPIQPQRHADLAASTTGGGSYKLSLVHRRSKGAAATFSYESSTDLVNWVPASPLVIVTDSDADGDNLTEIATATLIVAGTEARLNNEAFTSKAPPAVLEGARKQLADQQAKRAELERLLAALA